MEEIRFEEFTRLISNVYKSIQRIKTDEIERFGLKGVHVAWVYRLSQCPEGLCPAALAKSSGMNRSLISRERDLLLREGFVMEPAEGDGKRRYNHPLLLTEKGQELAAEIARVVRDIQEDLDRDVTEEELRIFYRVLHMIDKRLEERL